MSSEKNKVWIVPNIGVVERVGDNTFSNEEYVEEISRDLSPMGRLMHLSYPTTTTITLQGDIPPHWVEWDVMDEEDIDNTLTLGGFPQEIPGDKRLWIPRGEQSKRMRSIAPHAFFTPTPRGFTNSGVPPTIADNFSAIIHGIYMIIEKNTVASIKDKTKTTLPSSRTKKVFSVSDILHEKSNIADVCLVSAYTEPSTTTMQRIHYLAGVYGSGKIKEMIDSSYLDYCEEQVFSVEEAVGMIVNQK